MTVRRKWLAIALLGVLLLGIAWLAAGLPGMHLQPGQPFRLPDAEQEAVEALGGMTGVQRGFIILRGLLAAAFIIYPIYIIVSLLTKQGRQRLINDMIRLAVIGLLLYLLHKRGADIFQNMGPAANLSVLGIATPGADVPLAVFDAAPPNWIPTALLAGGAALLAILIGSIAWWWFMPDHRQRAEPTDLRQRLSDEAGQAVQAIQSGEEFQDVVLRAYYRMERILAEQQGLERPQGMTPSEFAESLGRQGFPKGAVGDLTHLFEAVRYGGKQLAPDAQQRAVNALNAIVISAPPKRAAPGQGSPEPGAPHG